MSPIHARFEIDRYFSEIFHSLIIQPGNSPRTPVDDKSSRKSAAFDGRKIQLEINAPKCPFITLEGEWFVSHNGAIRPLLSVILHKMRIPWIISDRCGFTVSVRSVGLIKVSSFSNAFGTKNEPVRLIKINKTNEFKRKKDKKVFPRRSRVKIVTFRRTNV